MLPAELEERILDTITGVRPTSCPGWVGAAVETAVITLEVDDHVSCCERVGVHLPHGPGRFLGAQVLRVQWAPDQRFGEAVLEVATTRGPLRLLAWNDGICYPHEVRASWADHEETEIL